MRRIKKIKLIIEVDEKYYEACKDAVKELYPTQVEEIIANGIPYNPTGDLISRSALKALIPTIEDEYKYVHKLIDNAPTVSLQDIYQAGHYDGHLEGYTKAINEKRPQVVVFCENGDEKTVEELKAELERVNNKLRPEGEWEFNQYDAIPNIGNYHCSLCHYIPVGNMGVQRTNFCPNCGADMRGDVG